MAILTDLLRQQSVLADKRRNFFSFIFKLSFSCACWFDWVQKFTEYMNFVGLSSKKSGPFSSFFNLAAVPVFQWIKDHHLRKSINQVPTTTCPSILNGSTFSSSWTERQWTTFFAGLPGQIKLNINKRGSSPPKSYFQSNNMLHSTLPDWL